MSLRVTVCAASDALMEFGSPGARTGRVYARARPSRSSISAAKTVWYGPDPSIDSFLASKALIQEPAAQLSSTSSSVKGRPRACW
jgi:hypothetical protein